MKITELKANSENPRIISKDAMEWLKKSISEFWDISWIVFNERTNRLIGGHQRTSIILDVLWEDPEIEIIKEYKDRKDGTKKIGMFRTSEWQWFIIRIVDWSEEKEYAANLTANNSDISWYFDSSKLWEFLEKAKSFDSYFELLLDDVEDTYIQIDTERAEKVLSQSEDRREYDPTRLKEVVLTMTDSRYIETIRMLDSMRWDDRTNSEIIFTALKNYLWNSHN